MKRTSIIRLCLLAATMTSAVAVASASAALPEFKTTTFPVKFTYESLLPLEPVLHSEIELTKEEKNIVCKMSTAKGEVVNAKLAGKISVHYTECKEQSAPTKKCGNGVGGASSGLIQTKLLHGTIGYVEGGKPAKIVGTERLPEAGTVLEEFTCEGEAEKVTVTGCVIGAVTSINLENTMIDVLFEEKGFGQLYTNFEPGEGTHKPCELKVTAGFLGLGKGGSWFMSNELVTLESPVEVKA